MDLQKIKTLLDFFGRSNVSELTVSQGGTTVTIRNTAHGQQVPAGAAALPVDASQPGVGTEGVGAGPGSTMVLSPVSGVVHRASTPGAAPLVSVGDVVVPGQGLFIVEAMKVFTTVPSSVSGVVQSVMFEDGQEVDAGQALVEIR